MSDLRPAGIPAMFGDEEVELLFTLNTIDEIQAECNLPFMDAIARVCRFADQDYTEENVKTYLHVATILINNKREDKLTTAEVARVLSLTDGFCWKLLRAYGLSIPEPDEEEDEEDDEKNVETGQ